MNQNFEAELLKNAIDIGDEIIVKAIIDSKGLHWRTVKSITPNDDVETGINETLYNGVSGILLFYVELYKATQSPIYLEYINSTAEWLINYCHKNPPLHGFYSGRMGTVYTLMKISEIDKKEYYRQQATDIALQFKNISDVSIHNFNLFEGLAGTILGLLYLYSEIDEDWILDSIYDGVDHLIKHAKTNGTGLYWDYTYMDSISRSTKPLCSLPFGSSGIGLLFLNLGVYFNNTDYQYIAEQAFGYENQFLNTSLKNWPDFRIDLKRKGINKLTKDYLKGNYSQFKAVNESLNWMHGIIGIGFTRLRASEIFRDKRSSDELKIVLDKLTFDNTNDLLPNYTLATGKSGLGLLFLELSIAANNKIYFEKACEIAKGAIEKRKERKFYQFGFDTKQEYEDDGLFMGNAGIGYFYLNLLKAESNGVLFPYLQKANKSTPDHKIYQFNKKQAIDTIINSWYPHTVNIINTQKLFDTSSLKAETLMDSFAFEIKKAIERTNDSYLMDAYSYEYNKQKTQGIIAANYCLFTFFKEIELAKNQSLLDNKLSDELMGETLQLAQYVKFGESKWNWTKNSLNSPNIPGETYLLYAPDGKEYVLSEIPYGMIRQFIRPQKVENIYKYFININNGDENPDYLKAVFFNLIKLLLKNGALISVSTPVFYRWYVNSVKKNKIEDIISA